MDLELGSLRASLGVRSHKVYLSLEFTGVGLLLESIQGWVLISISFSQVECISLGATLPRLGGEYLGKMGTLFPALFNYLIFAR